MKVVHIVGGDLSDGANRGTLWLHEGLKAVGVDSAILGPLPLSQQREGIVSLSPNGLARVQDKFIRWSDRLVVMPYPNRRRRIFSTGMFGRRVIDHSLIQSADVVNIHWTAKGPLSVRGIGTLGMLGKPIVWTLRDMWPFTGGCHYAMECDRYTRGCGSCAQLGSKRDADLSRLVSRWKEKWIPSSIKVVGISEWLSDCARQSRLFRAFDVQTIANCIDTDRFLPLDKRAARAKLGIDTKKRVVLMGAGEVTTFYKGFDLFVEATKHLRRDKIMILLFGRIRQSEVAAIPLEVRELGYLGTDEALRLAYSAADVFVAPSRQEAFGKTLVEAMSCGTPVVCFDATGPKDIVVHKATGYRAVPNCERDLADGINWVLEHGDVAGLGRASSERAIAKFGIESVALKYAQLYQEMQHAAGRHH